MAKKKQPASECKKPRVKVKSDPIEIETIPAPDPPEYAPGNSRVQVGRLASSIEPEPVGWFAEIFPKASFTLIVGDPSAGKSTLGAWLCSQAERPAILPGFEESIPMSLIPRLRASKVDLRRCIILDGRSWSLPHDRRELMQALGEHIADLLWIDPIDSYVECNEIDGPGVRAALESLTKICNDMGVTVIAARHPGKSAANICPGSRQWRAVPREIFELRHEPGPPERRMIRARKDPFHNFGNPRKYTLDGEHGKPRVFKLGAAIDPNEADSIGVAGDAVDRWKIDEAEALLKALLAESEQESTWIYAQAEQQRLGERTLRYAARRLGVIIKREGSGREHRSTWSLPTTPRHSGTPARGDGDTLFPDGGKRFL